MQSLKEKFEYHLEEYKKNHMFHSFEMKSDPNYIAIIELGIDVIPLIVEKFGEEGFPHLFGILSKIAGTNPIPYEDRGKIRKMQEHWRNWSKENII